MSQSDLELESPSEFAQLRATFPVKLWGAALVAACVLTSFVGAAAEPESSFVQEQSAPAAEAPAGHAG
jgi:hypothetical protein